jgi:VWFA-related protein
VVSARQLAIGLMLAFAAGATFSHPKTQANKDRKQARFGSSLDRLKWDSAKGAAVEKKERDKQGRDEALELRTLLVVFDVLVTDQSRRPVRGLIKDDFVVREEGELQEVATFLEGADPAMPRSIVLIVDYSGSQAAYVGASISAAKRLVEQLQDSDEMAVVSDDVELLAGFTTDKTRLAEALDSLFARARRRNRDRGRYLPAPERGRDLQFSALFATLRELVSRPGKRSVIIFQTDGTEAPTFRDQPAAGDYRWNMPARAYGLGDIYAAAERAATTIYSVIPGEPLIGIPPDQLYITGRRALETITRSRFETEAAYRVYSRGRPLSEAQVKLLTDRFVQSQKAVARVAELSGGWTAFLEQPSQSHEIYSRILKDVNQRYVIGYYPLNDARDGRLRRVSIEIRGHPDYVVHGRTGYYAPAG